jgi:hypothetical protein
MPPVRFEPSISAGERPKIYALNRAATAGTGVHDFDSIDSFIYGAVTVVLEYKMKYVPL